MRDINERPACHRAEDLVTYLYGEASEADALDFRNHLKQCDACRSEFAVFNQVHDSILLWRNEALGTSFTPAAVPSEATQVVRGERKLSALQALREFFNVSPLWLRGAAAFAALVLCVLVVLAISRSWQRPAPVATNTGEPKIFTKSDFDRAVAREVRNQTDKMQQASSQQVNPLATVHSTRRNELASIHLSGKPRVKALTRQEREQLAADLRLIPGADDEELPFASREEPNQ